MMRGLVGDFNFNGTSGLIVPTQKDIEALTVGPRARLTISASGVLVW
jgi:hypothetical protein